MECNVCDNWEHRQEDNYEGQESSEEPIGSSDSSSRNYFRSCYGLRPQFTKERGRR